MTTDHRAEVQALLTRAATAEAQRQSARDRRDWPAVAALEDELRRLWQRHSELEVRGASPERLTGATGKRVGFSYMGESELSVILNVRS